MVEIIRARPVTEYLMDNGEQPVATVAEEDDTASLKALVQNDDDKCIHGDARVQKHKVIFQAAKGPAQDFRKSQSLAYPKMWKRLSSSTRAISRQCRRG